MQILSKSILVVLTLFLLIGCGGGRMYVNEEADLAYYSKVGIIPFSNLTSEKNASEKVTSTFTTEILKLNTVDVANAGDFTSIVNQVVKQQMVDATEELGSEQARIIGQEAGVEGIFVGAVKDYGMVRSGQTQYPLVTVLVRFVDCQTGLVVWSYETSRKGGPKFPIFSFGETHTLGKMTTKVCQEVADSFGKITR